MSGPLTGIKIIEFSQIIAAPFAGSMLSDMGAEIIKIEPPTGDPWRYALEIIPGVPGFGRCSDPLRHLIGPPFPRPCPPFPN